MKLLNLITNLFKKKEILSEEEITLRELISKNIYITKEEKALKNLIVNNPEIAEKVYRTAKNKSYRTSFHFLLELAKIGYGKEFIFEKIHRYSYEREFLKGECSPEEEMAVKKWLACDTDDMPKKIPRERCCIVCMGDIENRFLASTSLVSEHVARECVCAFYTGHVDSFKWPVRGMLLEFGEEYTKNFLDNLVERYKISKEDCMLMFTGIYSIGYRVKIETEFYGKFVEEWMKNDEKHYKETISSNSDSDLGKKMMKKLGIKKQKKS